MLRPAEDLVLASGWVVTIPAAFPVTPKVVAKEPYRMAINVVPRSDVLRGRIAVVALFVPVS